MSVTPSGWGSVPVTPEHAAYLSRFAITPETALAAGLYSIGSVAELPPGFEWVGARGVPGIVVPWREVSGETKLQLKPDSPIVIPDDKPAKYAFAKGNAATFAEVRPAPDASLVLIVEGTKQALAAASYAPGGAAIYAIAGCRMWSSGGIPARGLHVVEERDVVVILDADAATNRDVYDAGERLGAALAAEGAASVRFAHLPGSGSRGIGLDDLLGDREPDRRAAYLANLVERAGKRPAPRAPKPVRKAPEGRTRVEIPSDRPQVHVDGDRLAVINNLTAALLDRWNEQRLFNHGEILSQLSGAEMRPVNEGAFLDLLAETVVCVRRAGRDGESVDFGWPDGQSVKAVMSRAERFAPLDRVARAPFVRRDGSVCQTPGYDAASQTMLVLDPALGRVEVPADPSAEQVAMARKLLMVEWLGDIADALYTDADRANMLALVLTPLVRGLVPVAPLMVIDGLQMGVGKNLLADCVSILATGASADPLPFSRDDEEVRKVITSAFRSGSDMFVFDEAHVIEGAALARALTSARYRDRQLSTNQMLGFPNRVTWISLGNRVRVEGDMVRRVVRVAIMPTMPNPQDRPANTFRHPNLRDWTVRNRAELLAAALTLVRAWFAKGSPPPSRGVSFGSFEEWERVLGGIVEVAGQPGFLDNLTEWRSETSFDQNYWNAHIGWLYATFGEKSFTCAEVRQRMGSDVLSEPPPGMTDLTGDTRAYNRELGKAYAKHANRFFGSGLQLVKDEAGRHNHVGAWRIVAPDGNGVATTSTEPRPSGENGGIGGDPTPSRMSEKTFVPDQNKALGVENAHMFEQRLTDDPHMRFVARPIRGAEVSPDSPDSPERDKPGSTGRSESDEQGELFETIADGIPRNSVANGQPTCESGVSDHAKVDPAYVRQSAVALPEGVHVFDIETGGDDLWTTGPDFVRLVGRQTGAEIRMVEPASFPERLGEAATLVGHNVMSFDLLPYARHHGLDLHELTARRGVLDTMLATFLAFPPEPGKLGKIQRDHSLDALGLQHFGVGKSGDLAKLAKEYGGFDKIPTDDARYVEYCASDVELTARLAMLLRSTPGAITPYTWREHQIAAIAAQMRLNGFRVDLDLLDERVRSAQSRREELTSRLTALYALPSHRKDGGVSRAPHSTAEGRAAILGAFADLGVTLPLTAKGQPSFGKDALKVVRANHSDPRVLELVEMIDALNGVRTVYETVQRCLVGDRVHPDVAMMQASGRWSITEPGLTVMGKRGGKHHEREVFVPEPGHVIIAADLSQVDARAVAAHAQDPNYLDLFAPGRDSHTEIALAVWGDASRRDDAKIIGHGWNYGMGLRRLAEQCGSERAAQEFHSTMLERFPQLVNWKRRTAAMADEGVYLDNGFGRRLRTTPGYGWTQGPALIGQSAARDILAEGLLRMPRELYPYLRAVVHDEVVLSVPADVVEDVERAVVEALSFEWCPYPDGRPVQIEAGLARRGASWGEVYEK